MTRTVYSTIWMIILTLATFAQGNLDNVHLFQNFYRDATITSNLYGEGLLNYANTSSDNVSISNLKIGARGGYGINPNLEVNAGLGFVNYSVSIDTPVGDESDSESGISDLTVAGRYRVFEQDALRVNGGAFLTLPIGSEDVGAGKLDFGLFGAARYGLTNGMVITGALGLDFYETTDLEYVEPTFQDGQFIGGGYEENTEYKNSLVLAGGLIYPYSETLAIVGELMFKTAVEYAMLSGGVDYLLQKNGRVRGALGIGLDDGAPDIMLLVSYLMAF